MFKSTKRNKAAGYADIDGNVIIRVYNEISYQLFMILLRPFNAGIFSEQLKVAKVSPIFKANKIKKVGNFRPISFLPILLQVLERLMYDGTYQYFKENDMFFPKKFGFQVNN